VSFRQNGAANLTRGDGPYAVFAIGLASGLPALARSGPSRGSLVKSAAAPNLREDCGPKVPVFFAPADRRRPAGARASAGAEARAPSRRRGRPRRAALKPYRKFSHAGQHTRDSTPRLRLKGAQAGLGPLGRLNCLTCLCANIWLGMLPLASATGVIFCWSSHRFGAGQCTECEPKDNQRQNERTAGRKINGPWCGRVPHVRW
jgi:hypothetical protein